MVLFYSDNCTYNTMVGVRMIG